MQLDDSESSMLSGNLQRGAVSIAGAQVSDDDCEKEEVEFKRKTLLD